MGRAERREGYTATDESPGVGSGTLTPDAFNQMITDSSAFSLTLDSGTRNAIQWIAAKDSILIGTTGGEWSLSGHGRDKPITPTSYNLRQHTAHGSKDLQPVLLTDGFAFVNYVGRKLFKLDYDGIDEQYTATELSILAEHITDSGIVSMALQRNPDPILWLVRDDGTLLSMTYDPKQDVVAWARHPMQTGDTETVSEPRSTVNTQYPLLRTTTAQDDPNLPHVTAISNVEELQNISSDLTGNYYLTNNIDASDTANWNSEAGFDPLGNDPGTKFTGTFDGCGYTISSLTINRPTENYVGLFGRPQGAARIANVTISSCTISGDSFVGALIGHIDKPTSVSLIQNCHASGTVTTRSGTNSIANIGGLIGYAQGVLATAIDVNIYDCSCSCNIAGTLSTGAKNSIGGFAGKGEQVRISNCYATGTVNTGITSATGYIGGFIGDADEMNSIDYCYATGNVTGYRRVGGFIGNSATTDTGYIKKSYATGNVTAESDEAGGFAGVKATNITDCYAWGNVTINAATGDLGGFTGIDFNPSTGDYTNCYCIGTTTGGDNQGGFIATSQSGTFTDAYWDTDTSGDSASDAGTGKTTTWLKTESNYPSTWDFDTIWYMQPLTQEVVLSVRTESVAVIPSTTEDEVWVTCNRTINSAIVRYIERMKPRDWGDDMEDMFFVDCGLTYDSTSTSSITGLSHLEGETVAVLADGAVQPTKTVSSGAITLTDAASVVQVGLPYTYKLKPMRLDQNTQGGTSKGSVKKITEAVISFYKTLNTRYGDGTDTYDINWRETSAEYTTPPDLVTGDKVVVADGGFSVEDPFQIEGNDPMPCSVRAIIPRIDQTGR